MAKSKRQKAWIIVGVIFAAIVLFWTTINVIPPKKNVENNPFIVKEGALPMIAAHRGGKKANPENTMLAFRKAVNEIGVDIIESDLYLTSDGYLVYNHDSYIDETCDVIKKETGKDLSLDEVEELCKEEKNRHEIKDYTLAQLQQFNFGYYFEDKATGERVYKDYDLEQVKQKGLQIATVEMLFEEFHDTNPDLLFIVEIKNGGDDRGYEACKKLSDTLERFPNYKNNIVVGTFHDEIETELKTKYPHLMRGAPTGTAAKFIISQFAGVNLFNKSDFACLQIPTSYDLGIEVALNKRTIIKRAHRRNIAVQYWTINDADEMRELIKLGCDAIMTDDPVLLKEVLEEFK